MGHAPGASRGVVGVGVVAFPRGAVAFSAGTGVDGARAGGGVASATTRSVDADAPASSRTVRRIANVPAVAYSCVAASPDPFEPSPQSQSYATIRPSGSALALAFVVTVAPRTSIEKDAWGGALAG